MSALRKQVTAKPLPVRITEAGGTNKDVSLDQFPTVVYHSRLRTMLLMEHFDEHPTCVLKTITHYTVMGARNTTTNANAYACKMCGALVLEDDRNKHATHHEDIRALLHQLTITTLER